METVACELRSALALARPDLRLTAFVNRQAAEEQARRDPRRSGQNYAQRTWWSERQAAAAPWDRLDQPVRKAL
jgi:hypothetical protein